MPCCADQDEDDGRLLVLPQDRRAGGRGDLPSCADTMKFEHIPQTGDVGLCDHALEFPFENTVIVASAAFESDRYSEAALATFLQFEEHTFQTELCVDGILVVRP